MVNHEAVVDRHHNRVAAFFAVAVLCASVLLSPCSAEEKDWMIGTELDLLPYLSGGYYLSLVGGVDKLRGRVVRTELTVPDFATDDAFTDNDLGVWALILDIYFKKDFKGWWIGPGLERWDGEVTEKSSGLRRKYSTDILTLGGGYTWRFSKHFYLNPWAAVHLPIGGDREIRFASDVFEINPTPEASVKLGIQF